MSGAVRYFRSISSIIYDVIIFAEKGATFTGRINWRSFKVGGESSSTASVCFTKTRVNRARVPPCNFSTYYLHCVFPRLLQHSRLTRCCLMFVTGIVIPFRLLILSPVSFFPAFTSDLLMLFVMNVL